MTPRRGAGCDARPVTFCLGVDGHRPAHEAGAQAPRRAGQAQDRRPLGGKKVLQPRLLGARAAPVHGDAAEKGVSGGAEPGARAGDARRLQMTGGTLVPSVHRRRSGLQTGPSRGPQGCGSGRPRAPQPGPAPEDNAGCAPLPALAGGTPPNTGMRRKQLPPHALTPRPAHTGHMTARRGRPPQALLLCPRCRRDGDERPPALLGPQADRGDARCSPGRGLRPRRGAGLLAVPLRGDVHHAQDAGLHVEALDDFGVGILKRDDGNLAHLTGAASDLNRGAGGERRVLSDEPRREARRR